MPHDGETMFAHEMGGFPTRGILGNLPLTYHQAQKSSSAGAFPPQPTWWPWLGTNCLQSKWKKRQLVEVELG